MNAEKTLRNLLIVAAIALAGYILTMIIIFANILTQMGNLG